MIVGREGALDHHYGPYSKKVLTRNYNLSFFSFHRKVTVIQIQVIGSLIERKKTSKTEDLTASNVSNLKANLKDKDSDLRAHIETKSMDRDAT